MSNKTKKKNKLPMIIILFCAICAGTVFSLWYFSATTDQKEEKSTENSTPFSTETVENTETSEQVDDQSDIGQKPDIVQNDGNNPNENEDLTGSITASNVTEDAAMIRVNIDQFLASGVCDLTLESNGKKVTKTANIVSIASTSTCEGFDVPLAELGSGKWSIKIQISSNNKQGSITGEINI